jgi:hypothetical protein
VAVVVAFPDVNAQDSQHGVPHGQGQPAANSFPPPGEFSPFAICRSGRYIPPIPAGLVTAGPPIPAHPRLGVRVAYRLQRVLRPTRAASQGRAADLLLLHRPADHRRWGESSWLNYWQGRDEGLWTTGLGEAGDRPGADR